jgi:DNA-binding GntR family transcriptional regulator
VRIRRLRLIEDEPFSFTINYLPVDIGRRVSAKELYSTPLLRILQEDLKIPSSALTRSSKPRRPTRRSRASLPSRCSTR